MSTFVLVSPEILTAASADLDAIGSAIKSASATAAGGLVSNFPSVTLTCGTRLTGKT
jgi:hypothetical protein